ncbi:MAG: hypothetical protein IKA11_02345 [Clostridia bacterium]|nr:hypothetical protein [Clostridia bacterium]
MKNQKLYKDIKKLSKKVDERLNRTKYLLSGRSLYDSTFLILFFIPFGFLYLCFYRPIKKLVYRCQIKNFDAKNQVLINDCCNYFKTKLPFFQDAIENYKNDFFSSKKSICNEHLKMNFIEHNYSVFVDANGFAGYSFKDYKLEHISEETLRALKYVVFYSLREEIEKQIKQNENVYKEYELSVDCWEGRYDTEYRIYLRYKGEEYQLESW